MSEGTQAYYHELLNIFVTEQYLTADDQDLFAGYLAAVYANAHPIPFGPEYEAMKYRIRRRGVAMEETVRIAFDGLSELAETGQIEVRRMAAFIRMMEYIVSDSAVSRHIILPIVGVVAEGNVWAEDAAAATRYIEGLQSNDWIGTFTTEDTREGEGWGNQWGLFWGS